jgi:hypothetical protein
VVAGAVDATESPRAPERLLVALDLAVALWSTWPDEAVLDAASVQELTQRAVVAVDERAVGEQSPRLDPELREVFKRPFDEAGRRLGALVAVQLAVGVAGARIERELVDQAPWVLLFTPQEADLVSERVGNYQSNPVLWGVVLLDQLWVR